MPPGVLGLEGRVMALDVGDRRIGVAVSDPLRLFARPLATLERRGEASDIAALAELVEAWSVQLVLVGLPLLPSGDEGEQAAKTLAFADTLGAALDTPVLMHDEAYSTVDAVELRRQRGGRSGKRDPGIDADAAAVILESWLRERPTESIPFTPDGGGDDTEQ